MQTEGGELEIKLTPEGIQVSPVTSVNGKTGDVVLTTSDLENTSDYQTGDEVDAAIATAIAGKQDTLTAGNNIQISAENVISATDTTYSAGNGLNLSSENVFSVDTTVVATQQNLATEVQNRENADNALQAQIDGISASSDVVDIVGTYADLQNYDTQHLKDNDIIKVLQDETQNDATTYYRWSTSTETFTLIGQEGPYYTKSAADAQFVPQTRTVNGQALSSNVTLTASDVGALAPSNVVQTTGTSTSQIMSQNATTQALGTKLNITDYVVDDELKNSTNPVQNGVLFGLLGDMPTDFFSGNATTEQTGTEAQFTNALKISDIELNGDTLQPTYQGYNLVDLVPITNSSISYSQSVTTETVMDSTLGRNVLHIVATSGYPTVTYNFPTRLEMGKYYSFKITYRTATAGSGSAANEFWFGFSTGGNTWDNLTLFNVGTRVKGADGDTSKFFNASDTWVTKSKRFYADPAYTSTDAFKRVQLSLGYGPGLNGVTAKEVWIADVQVCEITEAEWNADTYTSKDYEPYTGSTSTQITPSPNPDYPQDIQVVTGTQTVTVSDGVNSHDYTVNLGALELAKIGTYRDYIYPSGGDWYVHKALGKIILDGTEAYVRVFREKTNTYAIAITNGTADTVWTSSGYVNQLLSDNFTGYSFTYLYNASNDIEGITLDTANAFPKPPFVISLLKSRLSEVSFDGVKSWLAAHNTTIYYRLATATDTQITDSTLIGQLNSLYNAMMSAGQTNFAVSAVSPNLPAILDITVFNANAQGIIANIRG